MKTVRLVLVGVLLALAFEACRAARASTVTTHVTVTELPAAGDTAL